MPDPFSDEIDRLTQFLRRALASEPLPEACGAFVLGGKRLRSRLLFAASASNPLLAASTDITRAAAAIELVHAGSLLHDDVVDRCEVRRGVPALHRVLGVRTATRSGLHLVEIALALVGELPTPARERIATAARRLSRGQFLELLRLGDTTMGSDERIRIMELKTASVFGLSCELGAMLIGEDVPIMNRWRSIGEAFGLLFQIADDLDDIFGSEEELGRPTGADIQDGVMSLPILCGLESTHRTTLAALLTELRSTRLSGTSLLRCANFLQVSGAIDRTLGFARVYADTVCGQLAAVPSSRGTEWIAALVSQTLARCCRWLPQNRPEPNQLTGASLGR
jgi:heptaprenyl diphosphate synthase component 2